MRGFSRPKGFQPRSDQRFFLVGVDINSEIVYLAIAIFIKGAQHISMIIVAIKPGSLEIALWHRPLLPGSAIIVNPEPGGKQVVGGQGCRAVAVRPG